MTTTRGRVATERASRVVDQFETSVDVLVDALRAVDLGDVAPDAARDLHGRLEAAADRVDQVIRAMGESALAAHRG